MINPVPSKLGDTFGVQSGRPCSEFASRILSKILHDDLSQINLSKLKRAPGSGRFGLVVERVDKYTHPLIPSAVGVYCTAGLARRLDFDAVFSGFDAVVRVLPFNDEVGMTIEVTILDESPGMPR
jgi:hypothetical protein